MLQWKLSGTLLRKLFCILLVHTQVDEGSKTPSCKNKKAQKAPPLPRTSLSAAGWCYRYICILGSHVALVEVAQSTVRGSAVIPKEQRHSRIECIAKQGFGRHSRIEGTVEHWPRRHSLRSLLFMHFTRLRKAKYSIHFDLEGSAEKSMVFMWSAKAHPIKACYFRYLQLAVFL